MKKSLKAMAPVALALAVALTSGSAFAEGDAAKGKKAFKRCSACHSVEAGKNKVGPSLHMIIGRKAGSAEGYKYSSAFGEAGEKGLVWDADMLIAYLENPKKYLAAFLGKDKVKSKMANKFKKLQLREDIVAYLQSLQ
ncbi:cytochrome c family protein [Pelagibius sp. Alg239-R121]|uniref:c-type cytochrome n=1 Tax=Pelagibius sp. Alg239-R121 TaxID=2993448 RepID=UPI0024A63BC1|nr:c-type cytochrome [Pelagibius sp. Alg239-R121]